MSKEKFLIYNLLAVFQLAGAASPRILCEIAEETMGEPYSIEKLQDLSDDISRLTSVEEKVKLAKLIDRFAATLRSVKDKGEKEVEQG